MRKLFFLAPLALSSVAFAEGETISQQLGTAASTEIASLGTTIGPILIAAFGIVVAFVAYKLIKRAINKA